MFNLATGNAVKVVKHFFTIYSNKIFFRFILYFSLPEPTDQLFSQRALVHFNADLDLKIKIRVLWVFIDVRVLLLPAHFLRSKELDFTVIFACISIYF